MSKNAPPPAAVLIRQAQIGTMVAGQRIVRAHPHLFGSAELDRRPDADARFSTIRAARTVIPVLYGGEDYEAAASETIFHSVDTPSGAHRPRRVALEKYRSWQWTEVVTTRDLALVQLWGTGLDRFGLTRATLIETGRASYPFTQRWAQALAAALPDVDGLWWDSRQASGHGAVMLFGHLRRRPGGIRPGDLSANSPALPFATVDGLARLDRIAYEMDITVVRS